MDRDKIQLNFLLAFLVGASILMFFIFRPFFYALILALIFAVVCQPVYRRALKLFSGWPSIAALLTTVLIIVFILTPLVFLGIQVFKEAGQLYFSLAESSGREVILNVFRSAANKIESLAPGTQILSVDFDQYIKQVATWLVQHLGSIFSNFTNFLVNSFLFLLAFYYLLKNGDGLKKIILRISPLSSDENETILNKLELAVNSVVRGNLVIALIQGTLTAIGLTIFGVPNAVLWGMIAAITALIPGVGTSLVIIPSIAYLFLAGQTIAAAGLVVWGVLAVGLIDNFLGPKIVGRGMKLHPLLVILSVLGGIVFFGPMGFILGPLALSLFCALFDIYSYLLKKA
ncbi:MAG TPA: AI-2E family transporter [Candidatus Portnoybacteria bacterium]|nr:AI-2E family transporter [Candidatus Portnoybacteria bacterium]